MNIDNVLKSIDLHEWFLDYSEVKRAGSSEITLKDCPFCGDERYKLYVNTQKRLWICHHCKEGEGTANLIKLMAAVANTTEADIIHQLSSVVVESESDSSFMEQLSGLLNPKLEDDVFSLEYIELPGKEGFGSIKSKAILKYAHNRGITDSIIEEYSLRPAFDLKNIKGNYLLFPIIFKDIPVSFQGRRTESDRVPKYVSNSDIANWVWPCNSFGKRVYLVEGVFDALGARKAGFPAVCTFGNRITKKQVELLRMSGVTEVVFAWDPTAFKEVSKYVKILKNSLSTYIVDFSKFKDGAKVDPGDLLVQEDLIPEFSEALSEPVSTRDPKYIQTMYNYYDF